MGPRVTLEYPGHVLELWPPADDEIMQFERIPLHKASQRQVSMKLAVLLLLVGVVGCGPLRENTRADQLSSLQTYGPRNMTVDVNLPGYATIHSISAADFLFFHGRLVTTGEDWSEKDREKTPEVFLDPFSDRKGFTYSMILPVETRLDVGSCVPVTADGYFLTAAHVLETPNPFVFYLTSSRSTTRAVFTECRIVLMASDCDFAIFKAEIATPRYLKMHAGTPAAGDILFAGGWLHERAGGACLETETTRIEIDGRELERYHIMTSLPMIKGDSGSALINQAGELCGVISKVVLGRWRKLPPRSQAVMLDPAFIMDVIEADRRRIALGLSPQRLEAVP